MPRRWCCYLWTVCSISATLLTFPLQRRAARSVLHRRLGGQAGVSAEQRATDESLIGADYEGHFVAAYIGTPPQRQSLIIDTGSAMTILPCKACANCGKHADAPCSGQTHPNNRRHWNK